MVQVGDQLGPYQILEKIGQGGMAAVYRAHQQSVERDVALKVILRDIAGDPAAIQRFQREAKLIARLEHPHILPVYDFDGGHSPPYIVMRYLEGGTLKDWMIQGRLPHYEVVHLLQQICSALDYAHRQGIIHRDIKPSNILIDREGNAFVSDLGLARLTIHDFEGKQITETGMLMGTPDYMSPEQAMGIDEIDPRSDIYALGVMLFEMLSGSLPFTAVSGTLMLMQHIQTPPPSILDFDPTLPPAIEGILLRVLAKDREDRYQSALEFGEAASEALGITTKRSLMRSHNLSAQHPQLLEKGDSRITLSEQNKTVVVLNANAAEYSSMLDEAVGGEAARTAIDNLWSAAEQIIAAHGGRILAHTHYELLALWGADSAKEDDSEQAIRAALALQTFLRESAPSSIPLDEPLPLNIGIHRGLTLLSPNKAGDALSASGATIGFANRLMQNAEGTILISHEIFRQVLGIFDILEEVPLKVRGRAERILTYRVTAVKAHVLHIRSRGVEGIETPMVGRESEFKLLQRAFLTAVEDSETQAITIVSEAGIGKSRLFFEFDKWSELRPEEYESFNGRATPATTQRPYALLRDVIFTRFEVLADDPPETALRKIEQGIFQLVGWQDERASLIASLVGAIAAAHSDLDILLSDAQEGRRQARQAFIQFITALAKAEPVIIKLEDIHHADDASLDLLNDLFMADDQLHLLVITCARPVLYERRPSWGSGQPFHTRVNLKPLDKRESRELVMAILQRVPEVPKVLRDVLVERAEGNPLYLEELVKMLIDDRVILKDSDKRWRVEIDRLGMLNVPLTLAGLFETRFDTLFFPEKLALQRASVIGRIFYDTALGSLDAVDDTHLRDLPSVLEKLIERGFIYRRETSAFTGSVEYLFASAMLRDTLYDRLLERQRRLYHAGAAAWLAALDQPDEYLPLIADHYEKAENPELAAAYLQQAGTAASRRGGYQEAIRFYQRARADLPADTPTATRLSLLVGLIEALNQTGDLAAARAILEEALPLARSSGQLEMLVQTLYQFSVTETTYGNYPAALSYLNEALPLARIERNAKTLANVLYGLANTHFRMGNDTLSGIAAAEECLSLCAITGDAVLKMYALNRLGTLKQKPGTLGYNAPAGLAHYEAALALARQIGNRHGERAVLGNLGVHSMIHENWQGYINYTQQSLALAREIGDRFGMTIMLDNLADGYIKSGQPDKAPPLLRESLLVAQQMASPARILSSLSSIGWYMFVYGDTLNGLRILGLVKHHPAYPADNFDNIQSLLENARNKLGMSDADFEAEVEIGKDLDLDVLVERLLKDMPS